MSITMCLITSLNRIKIKKWANHKTVKNSRDNDIACILYLYPLSLHDGWFHAMIRCVYVFYLRANNRHVASYWYLFLHVSDGTTLNKQTWNYQFSRQYCYYRHGLCNFILWHCDIQSKIICTTCCIFDYVYNRPYVIKNTGGSTNDSITLLNEDAQT